MLERLGDRADGRGGEFGGLVGEGGVAGDAGDGLEAEPVGDALAGEDQGRGAVGDRGGVGGGDGAVLGEGGLERRDFGGVALGGLLVLVDDGRALAAGDLDGDDLAVEPAVRLGAFWARVREAMA